MAMETVPTHHVENRQRREVSRIILCLLLSDSITKSNSTTTVAFSDHLLFIVSSYCSNLHNLRVFAGPVSVPSLFLISKSCSKVTCITVSLSKPLFLNWVVLFTCLKELCLYISSNERVDDAVERFGLFSNEELNAEFGLETLFLSGIQADDKGVGWLWRNCKRLKKLQLKNCGSVGDGESFSLFLSGVKGLEEVELRKCRSIVDGFLLKLADGFEESGYQRRWRKKKGRRSMSLVKGRRQWG